MVTIADSSEAAGAGDHSLLGDILCVGSAMCYSCYTVMMQRELKEDDPDVPALFFGHVGVLVAVLGAPVVLALHWTGVYDLTALDSTALGLAFLNGEECHVAASFQQHNSLCPALSVGIGICMVECSSAAGVLPGVQQVQVQAASCTSSGHTCVVPLPTTADCCCVVWPVQG